MKHIERREIVQVPASQVRPGDYIQDNKLCWLHVVSIEDKGDSVSLLLMGKVRTSASKTDRYFVYRDRS